MLLDALAHHERPGSRRGSIRWAEPHVEVYADVHGRADGPVRDAVLRDIRVPTGQIAQSL